jgi:hypothetical protein
LESPLADLAPLSFLLNFILNIIIAYMGFLIFS